LIGDDIHSVAREMKEKLGINVFAFSCEGYKAYSHRPRGCCAHDAFFA